MNARLVIGLCLAAALTGCASHNLPRDAYLVGVKSTVNTPWGPMTLEVAKAATGTAANNASVCENLVAPPAVVTAK